MAVMESMHRELGRQDEHPSGKEMTIGSTT